MLEFHLLKACLSGEEINGRLLQFWLDAKIFLLFLERTHCWKTGGDLGNKSIRIYISSGNFIIYGWGEKQTLGYKFLEGGDWFCLLFTTPGLAQSLLCRKGSVLEQVREQTEESNTTHPAWLLPSLWRASVLHLASSFFQMQELTRESLDTFQGSMCVHYWVSP